MKEDQKFISKLETKKPYLDVRKKISPAMARVFFGGAFVLFFLSIALVRFFVIGVPVRAFFGLALFGLALAVSPSLIAEGFRKTTFVWLGIAYAAFLGLMVSLLNGNSLTATLGQIAEIHLQAVFGLILGYFLLNYLGPKKFVATFVLVVASSGIVAMLQALGLEAAWELRDFLQSFQIADVDNFSLTDQIRARGLSFTPVHLGTQLCLAFAATYAVRKSEAENMTKREFQKLTWVPILLSLLIAVVSGNRSPILGFLAFIAAYTFYARPTLACFLAFILIPLIVTIYVNYDALFAFLKDSDVRAFRVGDKSSEGREALRIYGLMLFRDRPLGYGLGFSSVTHASGYLSQLSDYDNAQSVTANAVHNFYLNVLNKYGILILPVAVFVGRWLLKNIGLALALVPYAVHAYFHNDGPLQSDFLIWFIVPVFLEAARIEKVAKNEQMKAKFHQ